MLLEILACFGVYHFLEGISITVQSYEQEDNFKQYLERYNKRYNNQIGPLLGSNAMQSWEDKIRNIQNGQNYQKNKIK